MWGVRIYEDGHEFPRYPTNPADIQTAINLGLTVKLVDEDDKMVNVKDIEEGRVYYIGGPSPNEGARWHGQIRKIKGKVYVT